MNKGESKFIYIALIVIVLLAGVLIYKVKKVNVGTNQETKADLKRSIAPLILLQ